MGASVNMPAGMTQAIDQPVVAFIGDSTFFHCGMTGLAHAVFNNHNFVLVILDNGITAMTGHQPSPAMDMALTGQPMTHIDIEKVVAGLGGAPYSGCQTQKPEKNQRCSQGGVGL